MDGSPFEEHKSADLVDSVLDLDEVLQNYLITLNPGNSVLQSPMESSSAYSYNLNVPNQSFNQYVPPTGQSFFQLTPSNEDSKAGLTIETEEGRTPYSRKRSPQDGVQRTIAKSSTQIQEKNRMAQKRFRERQKAKITELHGQINDLEQKVNQLVMENSTLQSRNSLLEKILAMRDEHIKIVQQQAAAEADQAEHDRETGSRRISLTLTAIKGKEVRLNTESLKKMTPEGVMQLWQTYVTEISSALVEASSHTGESSQNHVEELINEVNGVFMRLCVVNPTLLKIWHAREYHMSETDELKKWQSLLIPLELTDAQKKELSQLRKLLLDQLHGLVEERKKLHSTIQTILVTETASHKLALEYLKTNQTILRLREILRVENNAILQYCSTIIRKILKPTQVATLYVHAYPSKPDLLAFASAVAVELGEDITVMPESGSTEYRYLSDVLNPTSSVSSVCPGKVESSVPCLQVTSQEQKQDDQ
eukprot:g2236.t1